MKYFFIPSLIIIYSFILPLNERSTQKLKLPYRQEGLSERQAAAHLLSRFTFGARPGDIDAVIQEGLEHWVERQLNGTSSDDKLNDRLKGLEILKMDDETIVNTYLNAGQVLQFAQKNGLYKNDTSDLRSPEVRLQLKKFMDEKGLKAPQEMVRQVLAQKMLRAVYGENQLKEVLTDFWFNHFNVSFTKGQAQNYIYTYERDAIRPNVARHFLDLLNATAKHPAMLLYLDNAQSVSDENMISNRGRILQSNKRGLNENYAREVMELHTLGVDGGYTQKDVTELARVLTGWTIRPLNRDALGTKLIEQANLDRMEKLGFVVEGNFLYRANKHDQGEKTILGNAFPPNGGYNEGLQALKMLAEHPSTAKFISTKIATRFVCDSPSAKLISEMTEAFRKSNGDIKQVLIAMVNSREFWKKEVIGQKIKSPFELIVSAIRASNANLNIPGPLVNWCTRMGQKIYYYQAPTGFPDRASYWVNTGALLNRMNFGLDFAANKIIGVRLNPSALTNGHEPGSANEALEMYSQILLSEKDQQANINRLSKWANDVSFQKKIESLAGKNQLDSSIDMEEQFAKTSASMEDTHKMISHIVGIIIGSPAFQRR